MPSKAKPKSSPRRRWGAPRKADNRSGADAAFARAVANSLPGVKETRRQAHTFAVDGTVFLRIERDERAFTCGPAGEDALPLLSAGRDQNRTLIEDAWRRAAPPRAVAAFDKKRKARAAQPALTQDDVRRMILALPGAAEGPIWGSDIGFLIGTEKRTRFARFGPPAGSKVSNLLPPDDDNTVVFLCCEERPVLIAARPDLFFTTPHYGDPDAAGGVIVRLAEFRDADEIEELRAVMESCWQAVAPPDLVAEWQQRGGPI